MNQRKARKSEIEDAVLTMLRREESQQVSFPRTGGFRRKVLKPSASVTTTVFKETLAGMIKESKITEKQVESILDEAGHYAERLAEEKGAEEVAVFVKPRAPHRKRKCAAS